MIFSTFNQVNIFLIFLFFGFNFGIFSFLKNCINLLKKSKKIIKTLINTLFYVIFSMFFIFLINIFNFGIAQPFLLISYIVGNIWGFASSQKLLVFIKNKCYNNINKKKENRIEYKKN